MGSQQSSELAGNFYCFLWQGATSFSSVCAVSQVCCSRPQISVLKHAADRTGKHSLTTSNFTHTSHCLSFPLIDWMQYGISSISLFAAFTILWTLVVCPDFDLSVTRCFPLFQWMDVVLDLCPPTFRPLFMDLNFGNWEKRFKSRPHIARLFAWCLLNASTVNQPLTLDH